MTTTNLEFVASEVVSDPSPSSSPSPSPSDDGTQYFHLLRITSDKQDLSFVEKVLVSEEDIFALCNSLVPGSSCIDKTTGKIATIDFSALDSVNLSMTGFYGDKAVMARVFREKGYASAELLHAMANNSLAHGLYACLRRSEEKKMYVFYWDARAEVVGASRKDVSCNFVRYLMELCNTVYACVDGRSIIASSGSAKRRSRARTGLKIQIVTTQESENDVKVRRGFSVPLPAEVVASASSTFMIPKGLHRCAVLFASVNESKRSETGTAADTKSWLLSEMLTHALDTSGITSVSEFLLLLEIMDKKELLDAFEEQCQKHRQQVLADLKKIYENESDPEQQAQQPIRILGITQVRMKGSPSIDLKTIKSLKADSEITVEYSIQLQNYELQLATSMNPSTQLEPSQVILTKGVDNESKNSKVIFTDSKMGHAAKMKSWIRSKMVNYALDTSGITSDSGFLLLLEVMDKTEFYEQYKQQQRQQADKKVLADLRKKYEREIHLEQQKQQAAAGNKPLTLILRIDEIRKKKWGMIQGVFQGVIDSQITVEYSILQPQLTTSMDNESKKIVIDTDSETRQAAEMERWLRSKMDKHALDTSGITSDSEFLLLLRMMDKKEHLNAYEKLCQEAERQVLADLRKRFEKETDPERQQQQEGAAAAGNERPVLRITAVREKDHRRKIMTVAYSVESVTWRAVDMVPSRDAMHAHQKAAAEEVITPQCSPRPKELATLDPATEELRQVILTKTGQFLSFICANSQDQGSKQLQVYGGPITRDRNPAVTFSRGLDLVAVDEESRRLVMYDKQRSTIRARRFDVNFRSLEKTDVAVHLERFKGSSNIVWMELIPGKPKVLLVSDDNRLRVCDLPTSMIDPGHAMLPSPLLKACITADGSCFIAFSLSSLNPSIKVDDDAHKEERKAEEQQVETGGGSTGEYCRGDKLWAHVYLLNDSLSFLKCLELDSIPVVSSQGLQVECKFFGPQIHLVFLGKDGQGRVSSAESHILEITSARQSTEARKMGRSGGATVDDDAAIDSSGSPAVDYIYHVFDKYAVSPPLGRRRDQLRVSILFDPSTADNGDVDGLKWDAGRAAEWCDQRLAYSASKLKERGKEFDSDMTRFSHVFLAQGVDVDEDDGWEEEEETKMKKWEMGEWIHRVVTLVPVQIARAENNSLKPLLDGLQIPAAGLAYNNAASLSKHLRFGLYDLAISSWRGQGRQIKVISSMGKQSSGKSYLLNHLAGTCLDVAGGRCTDGVWMTVRKDKNFLYVLLDYEGLGSFERSDQEDMLLSILNAAISNVTIFNKKDPFLDRETEAIFQRFQDGVSLVEDHEKLFKGVDLDRALLDIDEETEIEDEDAVVMKWDEVGLELSVVEDAVVEEIKWEDLKDAGFELSVVEEEEDNTLEATMVWKLKQMFERKVGLQEKDPEKWHTMYGAFLGYLVERRWKRVMKWVEVNTRRFGAGAQQKGDVEKLKLHGGAKLANLKSHLIVCAAKCGKCFLKCVFLRGHQRRYPHSCEGTHRCTSRCDYCPQEDDVLCGDAAGHAGAHDCKQNQHTCTLPCIFHDKSSNCNHVCSKKLPHDGDHVCNSLLHTCKETCSLPLCSNTCVISYALRDHERHECHDKVCPAPCSVTGCGRLCAVPDHFHDLQEGAPHFCGDEHPCPMKCEMEGICHVETELVKQTRTFTGKRSKFQYEYVSEQTETRKACCLPIPRSCSDHDGRHMHSTNPNAAHYCPTRCPACGYYCNLPIHHPGLCSAKHGNMKNTMFVSEVEEIDLSDTRKYARGESGMAEMCNMHCKARGRGHTHLIPCPAAAASSSDIASCTEGIYDGARHVKEGVLEGEGEMDELTHKAYWEYMRFEDPCDEADKKMFAMCANYCRSQDHEQQDVRLYCTEKLWHEPVKEGSGGGGGYVTQDGHHFECHHVKDEAHNIVFVIDRSWTMGNDDVKPTLRKFPENRLGCVYEAVERFIRTRMQLLREGRMAEADTVSVVMFDDTVQVAVEGEVMSEGVVDKLLPYGRGQWTHYDKGLKTAGEVLDRLRANQRDMSERKSPVIIFLGDGDHNGPHDPMVVLTTMKNNNPLVLHTILFGTDELKTGPELLRKMANAGGGTFKHSLDEVQLAKSFQDLANSLTPKLQALVNKYNN